jgi:hypothetical protein
MQPTAWLSLLAAGVQLGVIGLPSVAFLDAGNRPDTQPAAPCAAGRSRFLLAVGTNYMLPSGACCRPMLGL